MLDRLWEMDLMMHQVSPQRSTNATIWMVKMCSLEWAILESIGKAPISMTPIIRWRKPQADLRITERSLCISLSSATMRLRRMAMARMCVERSLERRTTARTRTLCTMYWHDNGGWEIGSRRGSEVAVYRFGRQRWGFVSSSRSLWALFHEYPVGFEWSVAMNRYRNKARISSNSWGSEEEYSYDSFCVQADEFVWDYNDMLVLFAAGNEGEEGY